jgi:Fe-S cluster assembly protein SufD
MTVAEEFLDRTRAHPIQYAPWLDRTASLDQLANIGLPEPRSETWKYSNPNRWYSARPPIRSNDVDIRASSDVVIANFADAKKQERDLIASHLNSTIDNERFPLAAVNNVMLHAGLLILVSANAQAEIELGSIGGGYEHVLVIVESGAVATLVERPGIPTHRIVESVLEEGASLVHARLQTAAGSTEYHLISTRVSENAEYKLTTYAQGAALRRNDIHVEAAGENANIELMGAWCLTERQHLDTQISVHHTAPGARSKQTIRGVIDDRGKAVFNGRIYIAAGAQDSDAALTTKNLLLSPTSEVYAKPELEIYANDVRCSHGASVGELDSDALFYLRSRGVKEPLARKLLIAAFLREAVSGPVSNDAKTLLDIPQ